jgi:ABC-type sugar transport system ATPase subunit
MHAIFGIDAVSSGDILLEGVSLRGKETIEIIKRGIGLVPEDRKAEGIFPELKLSFNITLKVLYQFIKGIFVNSKKEEEIISDCIKNLAVKAASGDVPMRALSGGNQQKAIIGSVLAAKPKVLIFDEPTRGIDVRAKSEIYAIMDNLAKEGVAILMVSSELPEILNMSDRIVVMREGAIAAIIDHSEATQENIMRYAVV